MEGSEIGQDDPFMTGSRLSNLIATLDPDERRRGRQFEEVCRWYLLNDPIYRAQLQQVWLWDDWPGRWGEDAGIDPSVLHQWSPDEVARRYASAYRPRRRSA